MATEFHVSTDYILGLEQKKQMERHIPMRLMSTSFKPGECLMLVNQLEDPASREMAYCEYYYFTGQHDKAVNLTILYLNHPDQCGKGRPKKPENPFKPDDCRQQ